MTKQELLKYADHTLLAPTATEAPASAENTAKCEKCGAALPANAKFCLECGEKVAPAVPEGMIVCPECGKTYHVIHLRSKVGGKCESCHVKLSVRADDAPDVVRSRLEVYHSTTEPLKDFYREKGVLRTVDGADSVEETTRRTLEALEI